MFDRAPTFHVGAHIYGLRIFCTSAVTSWTQNNLHVAQLLLGLRIFHERRHFRAPTFQGADILPRAPTFRAPTFYVGRRHLSYIHLGSSVCHPVCHPVILSSCHPVCRSCGTLSYSLCFSNHTDQGDETEGLKMEGLEMERQEMGRLKREGVNRLFFV